MHRVDPPTISSQMSLGTPRWDVPAEKQNNIFSINPSHFEIMSTYTPKLSCLNSDFHFTARGLHFTGKMKCDSLCEN